MEIFPLAAGGEEVCNNCGTNRREKELPDETAAAVLRNTTKEKEKTTDEALFLIATLYDRHRQSIAR